MNTSNLNTKDLMVGDWVKIKTYGVSDKYERTEAYIYVKVAEIGSGLITVEYNNDIKEPYRICENTEIKPILLTPEILEKNGFEYKEKEVGLYGVTTAPHYVRDDVPFEVFCDGEPFAIWFKDPVDIKYIHQLQQALRLCGISKEIGL